MPFSPQASPWATCQFVSQHKVYLGDCQEIAIASLSRRMTCARLSAGLSADISAADKHC